MEEWLRPMLAVAQQPRGHAFAGDWQVERKYDGWRAMVHLTEQGEVRLIGGRNSADYSGKLPEIEAEIKDLLPPDTVIDCEIVGRDWSHVQSVMTSSATTPQEREGIWLVVFDITRMCTRDIRRSPLVERRDALAEPSVFSFAACSRVALSDMVRGDDAGGNFHQQIVEQGGEGTVWKRLESPYLSGAKSPSWLKWKHEATSEAVVTGFKPGNGEFQGLVGAIEFRLLENGVRSRASGMDMSTRQQMTAEQDKWIGSVIEIKHNGLMASGAPRHPQFLRKRDDRVATAARKQRPAGKPRDRYSTSGWRRNYAAMTPEKLFRCIHELEVHSGDAYQRVIDHGADPTTHLRAATGAAEEKGLLRGGNA